MRKRQAASDTASNPTTQTRRSKTHTQSANIATQAQRVFSGGKTESPSGAEITPG